MKVKNFAGNIHDTEYDTKYYEKMIHHDTMICDYGRDKEKLSGHWHF
ncbi:MAG TPA: hypothetical protein GX707_18225, partial [Epulopiscium sp.]|nr:hypothetical protein [Candidatus Epulonipiscium sp.]